MQGADYLNIKRCRLLQHILDLGTVFSDNPDIITTRLIRPVILHIQRTEFSESVSGKKHLIRRFVCHHNLGPMHHGRVDKIQLVYAQCQFPAVCRRHLLHRRIQRIELVHHLKCLRRRHNLRLRVFFQEQQNVCGVIRLHVLHHQIIRLTPLKHPVHICHPLLPESLIHRIHHRYLLVQYHIGIVCHPVGNMVLPLKYRHLMVIYTYIINSLCYFHINILLARLCGKIHTFPFVLVPSLNGNASADLLRPTPW